MPNRYHLAGAGMGGLITLLQLRRHGPHRISGLINIEGNLSSEDCMFSRRVIEHPLDRFYPVFAAIIEELRESRYAGDQMVAHNMTLNVDVRAYHAYSFETVAESDSRRLLGEFLNLPVPRLFLYGEANRHLSYLGSLRASGVDVVEIPRSAHFLFYDNPERTFESIGAFVKP